MKKNWLTRTFDGAVRNAVQRGIEKRSSLENPQTPLSFPAEWLL